MGTARVPESKDAAPQQTVAAARAAELGCLVSSCVNSHSQQHVLVMCATAFYLIENYPLDAGPEFSVVIGQVSGPCFRRWGGGSGGRPIRGGA